MGEFCCLPASTSNHQFTSFQPKSLACIALTMQEATNISIEAAGSQHAGTDPSSNERLTPSLARATSGTPARDFPALPSPTDEKIIKGDKRRGVAGKVVVSPEGGGSVVDPASGPDAESTVDAITFPVMCMSIDDANPLQLESDDPEPLTESSFREAYSTAEAVTSFLDRQLRHQHDRYGGGPEEPPKRRGRFQRRNSFVVHNKKRSRSLEDRDGSGPGAGASRQGEAAAAAARSSPAPVGKPRFDVRSQSEGTLMGPASTPVPPLLGVHRLSLPWKRKKGESQPGPASSTNGET